MPGIIREIELPLYEQDRGKLVPIDLDSAIPFEVKRTYYFWSIPPGAVRAAHAHTIEKEFFICLRGRCTLKVSTDGSPLQPISLNAPQRGMFIDNLVWHEFSDFSPDAIMLAFSSTEHFPDNYINSFEEFKAVAQQH
jgi:dTDP-4-dehydrorhamnose 3,5-epimerase-like enzyme